MKISEARVSVYQEEDTEGRYGESTQDLTIEYNGSYYVLETDRWAFESLNDLTNQIATLVGKLKTFEELDSWHNS